MSDPYASYTRRPPALSSLYVVEFDQGTIKVGYSATPVERIAAHVYQAGQFGIGAVRQWVSEPHPTAYKVERTLVWWCKRLAVGIHGSEWFTGLDFDEVQATAAELLEGALEAGVPA